MSRIALKIDVDTDRGTLEGVPRLVSLFERLDVRATFLFSLGPDQTGRAVKRAFRRGSIMRNVASHGFEVGVHTYNHVKWQDNVAAENESWTRRELTLARDEFAQIFSRAPVVHGAAGWQVNRYVPRLEQELGFQYASDGRGTGPFVPVAGGIAVEVAQMPTTLPTLDELIGRPDLEGVDPIDHLFKLTEGDPERDHVYTLHAELEGNTYVEAFERLIRGWRDRGADLIDLAAYAATLRVDELPRCEMVEGTVEGRSGTLSCQGLAPRLTGIAGGA